MWIIGVDYHPSSKPALQVHSGGNLFRLREIFGRISVAKLDSYGPDLFGALVPVSESDFGCRGPSFGGELTLKKARLNPGGEPVVVIANRAEPG